VICENAVEDSNKIKLECGDSIFRMMHVMSNLNDLRDNNEG
jgi:hypothetical protein